MDLENHGSEYDAHFTTLSDTQLWDGMVAIERVYSDRCTEFDAALERHRAALSRCQAIGQFDARAWQLVQEAWAEIRGAQAGAAEQGKMLSAVNREIRRRMDAKAATDA